MKGLLAETRFWLKVYSRGDCWEWRGYRDKQGYGQFGMYGETLRAHRVAFIMAKGPIPPGMTLDHLCYHPWCVKPSHLVVATMQENNARSWNRAGLNARKTHCKYGHAFTPENTYMGPQQRRQCRCCKQRLLRAWQAKKRAARGVLAGKEPQ